MTTPTEWRLRPTPGGPSLQITEWGSGRPIVILHGFLEQGPSWSLVAPHLPGRVIAPDQRGHGLSDWVGPGGHYHFWNYVPDIVGLLRHLDEPVDLIGHSMGGTVACYVAALAPAAVRRLVLVEGLGPPDLDGTDVDRAAKYLADVLDPPKHRVLASIEEGAARMQQFNRELPADLALSLARRTLTPKGDGFVWTWDPRHRARTPYPFRAAMFTEFLKRIEAPTLYIEGSDSYYRIPDLGARLSLLADARRVTLAGGTHMPHHGQPQILAEHIRAHLES